MKDVFNCLFSGLLLMFQFHPNLMLKLEAYGLSENSLKLFKKGYCHLHNYK
jgi:hypothetical protein